MYCPKCGAEYIPGISECAECDGIPLVADLSLADPEATTVPSREATYLGPEPAVVFSTGKPELMALAQSVLLSADMAFVVRGEWLQDLFGWGRFPAGSNAFMGPMQLLVSAEDASDAKELLAGLEPSTQADVSAPSGEDTSQSDELSPGWKRARSVGRIVVFVLLGWWLLQILGGVFALLAGMLNLV